MQLKLEFLNGTDWKDFATVKKWKHGIEMNSKKGDFPKKTWERSCTLMPYYMEFTQLTPDELIEESISDREIVRDRLRGFFNFLKNVRGIGHNPAITGSYGTIRGFYTHNNVILGKIKPPMPVPAEVETVDANYPCFRITEKDVNGRKIKKKTLNREPLKEFRSHLSFRDRLIHDMLICTGMTIGDILKLDTDVVLNHNPEFSRIFINNFRNKTCEIVSTFCTKNLTKNLMKYYKHERIGAEFGEPLFSSSMKDRKAEFKKQYGRTPKPHEYGMLPVGSRLTASTISKAFQRASSKIGIKVAKGKQQPYRPARWRHVYEDALIAAGIDPVIIDIFKGTVNRSGKPYPGKSREELEYFYEMAEPNLTVDYDDVGSTEEIVEQLQKELTIEKQEKEDIRKEMREKFAQIDKLLDHKMKSLEDK